MPRGQRTEGYTAMTAAVEKLIMLGMRMNPGDDISYSEIARYLEVSIEKHRDILIRARRAWARVGVYFDSIRGYGIHRARPIDNKYDSSRQAIGVGRKAKKTIQRLQSTNIVGMPLNEQSSLAAHLGLWGFIGQSAMTMAKEPAPRPGRTNVTPKPSPEMVIFLGGTP
jgi:hypothetical protein